MSTLISKSFLSSSSQSRVHFRMSLRTACPNFRHLIGDPSFQCEKLNWEFNVCILSEDVSLGFNEDKTRFFRHENGCRVWFWPSNREVFLEGRDFLDLAGEHLQMLIDNPNLEIDQFEVIIRPSYQPAPSISRFLVKIESILKDLKAKLKTKSFQMIYKGLQDDVLKVLPYLDSEYLEALNLCPRAPNSALDKIVDLEQFKNVKVLKMFDNSDLAIESWWDFPSTDMKLRHVKLMDLKRILEHFRRSPNFAMSVLKTNFKPLDIVRELGGAKTGFRPWYDVHIARLPRTKTKNLLNVRVEKGTISIDNDSGDEEESDEEEEVDPYYESRRILEALKKKFCVSAIKPVLLGVEAGVVKHFEWDQGSKAYQTVVCDSCRRSEEELGEYGIQCIKD